MVKSNDFRAETLKGAIKKATAAYQNRPSLEHKGVCSDLAFDFADFKREAGRALDRAEDLKRESERLEQSAREAGLTAVVSAAIAAAAGFGTAVRALRLLRRKRFKDLDRDDWLSLVPVWGGGISAAFNAYRAVRDSGEARRLAREAEAEERRADSLGDEIVRIANAYRRAGCNASRRIS